ncbi:hypothetical protein ABZ904_46445 [Streptomyces sp. NPDC046900]|uniref:hypothetical protein n=1 Tax=Streptomyces sp. NPDC046900 TaxID=3155473 RepID=UPI0033D328A1
MATYQLFCGAPHNDAGTTEHFTSAWADAIAAVAAIGWAGLSSDGARRGTARPPAVASDRPGGGTSSAASGGLGRAKRPATAKDTEAHCRAYEQVKDRGKALKATVWQRLAAAAGGKDKVAAYCTDQLARAAAAPSKPGKSSAGATDPGKGTAGNVGASGNDHGGVGNAAGKNGDKGSGKHK